MAAKRKVTETRADIIHGLTMAQADLDEVVAIESVEDAFNELTERFAGIRGSIVGAIEFLRMQEAEGELVRMRARKAPGKRGAAPRGKK